MKILQYNTITKKETIIEAKDEIIIDLPPPEPSPTELLQAEIADLEARLAKVEAVPLVKTALDPVIIKEPIISK